MQEVTLVEWLGSWLGSDHWMILAFAVILFSLIVDFVQRKVLKHLQTKAARTRNPWDDAILHTLVKPISFLIWLFGITVAAELAFRHGDRSLLRYVAIAWQLGLIIALAWFLVRLTRAVERNILADTKDDEQAPDETTVDAIGKLIRIAIWITTGLVVLSTLGVEVSAVMAFGGIGGLAIGLAAKDLLANFFGGLTVYLDRPFKVGDWISSPDRTIEGTVERIGWRQTTIRKFDKRPIYVPNATFTTITVENPSRMSHRRIYETIGIRYEDAGKMSEIVNAVKNMLINHPEIDTSQTLIVNFNAFAASSLDFFVYTFTKTTNWIKYHEVKEDVLLKIEQLISNCGAEIAFPTSTLHVASAPQFTGLVNPLDSDARGKIHDT